MPTKAQLIQTLKGLGITKGLSTLNKQGLENMIGKKIDTHVAVESGTLTHAHKVDILRQYTKTQLLKIIAHIKPKNLSKLKHQELINVIARDYWQDFHTRLNKGAKELGIVGSLPLGHQKAPPKPKVSKVPKAKPGPVFSIGPPTANRVPKVKPAKPLPEFKIAKVKRKVGTVRKIIFSTTPPPPKKRSKSKKTKKKRASRTQKV